ncbi:MAG: rhodanese-like domain-containing protein [Isosphaeraceae bacterium]|nr:rhodanese-like domain-containing protein [Isosphaeraceae bacterium]
MAVNELKQRLDRAEPLVLLDVREHDERAHCSIVAGGIHVPLREVPGRIDEIRAAMAATPLVVYCHHGVRSMTAATWLAQQGLAPIYNLQGGIDAWSVRIDQSVRRY